MNAWADHVNHTPRSRCRGKFLALHVRPTHFSVSDLVALSLHLARATPDGDGADLQDMGAIQRSEPARFNAILRSS